MNYKKKMENKNKMKNEKIENKEIESCRDKDGNIVPTENVLTVKGIQGNQLKKYDFTYNNYDKSKLENLGTFLKSLCCKYAFQEEIGDQGTPHLQGCIWLKKAARMTELLKHPELAHCSFRKIRSWEHASVYCTKEDTRAGAVYVHNVAKPRRKIIVLEENKFYYWEKDIVKIISEEPDDRKIYWYYEIIGNTGKSTFAKYLAVIHNALILSGKASDMKYGIVKYVENKGDYPELIVFDVPRTSKDYLSYGGIESVKNGCFFSGKYESDMVIGNPPHLFIFANFEPDYDKMSKDRWSVVEINEKVQDEVLDDLYGEYRN